ncbi:protein artichoke [Onthophagus taurus]|uniref:protein artichoke n=1 Tax=Onthophagus taurus TaxID=166361 RepID=UPI0039BE656B
MMSVIVLLILFGQYVMIHGEYIPPGPLYRCPKDSLLIHPCKCVEESDIGVKIRCENSNLGSMSVGLNNLATFNLPIEELTLYKCHIARLFGSLLYKLQLRTLYIEDTPIETMDQHAFLGVNNTLNELHILNSNLIDFPKDAFKILGNLTLLVIKGHNISSLSPDILADSDLPSRLLRFHLTEGPLSSIDPNSLQSMRKLKTLDLHGNRLKDLKRNQFRGLREVEVLDLSHNGIIKLDSSHVADLIKMGWCNVSHNLITEIARGAFARNAVLKVLNMSHNKIKRIDSTTFRGMRFLRRLYLSDNLIADVARGTFASITRIGTVDLARNFIKKIDYQMFYQLQVIEHIDLSENNITIIEKQAFKDIYLSLINVSHNAIETIESGAFENCVNITILDMTYNKIKTIPKRAFDETTYATELRFSYNLFTELSQIPLQNMTGLKLLNVSHNEIVNISKNTFPKLYELHTIDLSYNNLTDIYNSVFQVLFSLRTLDLSHNHLEKLKPGTFGTLPTLLELDLSYNRLKDIPRSALSKLASTRKLSLKGNKLNSLFILPISTSHLDLSYNEFKEIPPKLWPSMNSLLSLDLSNNYIADNLVKGSFLGLLTLQTLNLNYNGLTKPPWEALSDFTSLQYLFLEGNNITKLEKSAFGVLPVVFELNLAHNQIGNVSEKAFDGLLQMLKLNLTHNNLTYIPNGAFLGLVALKTLDLSFNKIEKLDNKTHGLLDDLLSLEHINLSNNKISFISRKMFPSNPYYPYKLYDIDLSYNHMPIITYDLIFGTSKVKKLNISHNAIGDVRKYVLGNLTSLQILDLSYNKMNDLMEEDVFKLPPNMTQLYLRNNLLGSLPWKEVNKLELLDLRFNNIESINSELTKLIVQDADVFLEGNPISCDCFVRPFKRYISKLLEVKEIYKPVKCLSPPFLYEKLLYEVPEEKLNCPSNVNTTILMEGNPGDYEITPDLRFREFNVKEKKLRVKWRVMKNEDIGDTYLVVRKTNSPSTVVFEATVPYFQRSFMFDNKWTRKFLGERIENEVCLIALDSKSIVRNLYQEQCKGVIESRGNAVVINNVVILQVVLVCFFKLF